MNGGGDEVLPVLETKKNRLNKVIGELTGKTKVRTERCLTRVLSLSF